ncbi:hypothetical protein JCM5353_008006, partial [Sporobolomyces roseus]
RLWVTKRQLWVTKLDYGLRNSIMGYEIRLWVTRMGYETLGLALRVPS